MKMKRLQLTFLLLFGIVTFALAQMKVSGKISDPSGEPLVGASIVEKGTTNGAVTDTEGNFSLTVKENSTVQVSMVGFGTQDIVVGSQSVLNVTMTEGTALNEVIVTALGISREKKSLGYSAQDIKGSDLTAAPEVSPINNLNGRIAGLTITRGTYGPGSSTRVVLRGERLIAGDNQPLYVIDGMPMDNSQSGGGPGEFNGADNGDGISNLNPDDIENISVLKGANAAALYGSRANNGAIVITTKKGAAGRTAVTYSTNFSTDAPTYKLKPQSIYGQGDGGKFSATDNSWGPKMDTASFVYNNKTYKMSPQDHLGSLLQNGNTWNNNLSISAGNDRIQTRFSVSNLQSKGIIPGNELNRTNFDLRTTAKLTDALSIDTKINYLVQEHKNRPSGGEEASNAYSDAIRMPTSVPLESVRDSFEIIKDGKPTNNFYVQGSIIGNPWWMINRIQLSEKRNRITALVSADYKLMDGLSVIGRVGLDKYFDNTERKIFAGTPTQLVSGSSAAGDFSTGYFNVQEFNAELLARYTTKLTSDVGLTVTGGTNLRKFKSESGFAATGGLDFLNLFTFNNGLLKNTGASPSEKEVQSIYGMASFDYKNYLYLDITGRNDWSSTLPVANRSYFYPSVSLSAVVSEMIKMPDFVSFGKIRASYAQVGNDISPYQLQQYLQPATGVVGTILTNNSTRIIGDDLKPQLTESLELGADFKFLNNRLGIDVTYYKTNTINQVLGIALKPSSGFSTQLINAGDIQNSGIEVLFTGTPVKTKDLRWDVTINFAKNTNKVLRLTEGVENFGFAPNRISKTTAKVGDRLGEVFVKGFLRDTASGAILVDSATKAPRFTKGQDVYVGNIAPDWTAGISNAISYKGVKLDFLFDYRSGGVVVSHTQAILAGLGKAEITANRDAPYIVQGVNSTLKDKVAVSVGSTNTLTTTTENYYKAIGGRGAPIGEAFTYDATVLRLRQVTLSYALPKSTFSNSKLFKSAVIGVYGRNLWFSSKAPFDPEIALNTGINGQGIDFYAPPSNSSIGFNLNVGF